MVTASRPKAQTRTRSTNTPKPIQNYSRTSKLESRQGEVIRAILSDKTQEQVAAEFGVSRLGIVKFTERHRAEIDALIERAKREQEDLWIMDRRKTSVVLQRTVRKLDERMPVAFGTDAAALAREINRTIQTAYKVNDMWPKTTGVTVDNRTQTVNFLEATRLSTEEVQELLGGNNAIAEAQ